MHKLYQLSLGLLALISLGLVSVKGQSYCDSAAALSRTNYAGYLEADSCSCGAGSVCAECVAGTDSGIVSCVDGCTYTSGAYTVRRTFTSSYFTLYVLDIPTPSILLGFSHEFKEGAQGNFVYTYEGVLNDDLSVSPASGGTCSFSFNGADCACDEYYCDAAQTTSAYKIDCSALVGGDVLDLCYLPEMTNTSTLLEILYAIPRVACGDSPANTAPTGPAPVQPGTGEPSFPSGLTSAPATGPDAPPQNNAPTSPSTAVSTATEMAAPFASTTAEEGAPSASAPTTTMAISPAPAAMKASQSNQPLATSNALPTLSAPQTDPALASVGGTVAPNGSQFNRGVSSVGALSVALSGCAMLVTTSIISTL
jgi:hypothetical protein